MATITAAAGGGNWTSGGTWSGGVAPTAADDVVLASTSGNVTIDTGAVGRSLSCTGYTGTLTHTAGVTLTLGDATAGAGNVALLLVSTMTYTLGAADTSAITFVSTSATTQTITTGGKTLGNWTVNCASNGSYQLADSNTTGATATVTLTKGTLDLNGQTCSWGKVTNSNSNIRTLTMGSSTVTLKGTSNIWFISTATNLTLNPGTSTIVISDTSSSAKMFTGGGKTYNNLSITGGGAGTVTLSGANTFNTFTINAPKSVVFPSSATTTVTSFVAVGSAGNVITITATTSGTAATLSQASGTVNSDYLSLKDSAATGGATWNAGSHSTNVSGNSGWLFGSVLSVTQTAAGRIALNLTKQQSATARISQIITRQQFALARIALNLTKTQPAAARIAVIRTKTQPAAARIAVRATRTQTLTARIAVSATKQQTATGRIAMQRSIQQGATARVLSTPGGGTFAVQVVPSAQWDASLEAVSAWAVEVGTT